MKAPLNLCSSGLIISSAEKTFGSHFLPVPYEYDTVECAAKEQGNHFLFPGMCFINIQQYAYYVAYVTYVYKNVSELCRMKSKGYTERNRKTVIFLPQQTFLTYDTVVNLWLPYCTVVEKTTTSTVSSTVDFAKEMQPRQIRGEHQSAQRRLDEKREDHGKSAPMHLPPQQIRQTQLPSLAVELSSSAVFMSPTEFLTTIPKFRRERFDLFGLHGALC